MKDDVKLMDQLSKQNVCNMEANQLLNYSEYKTALNKISEKRLNKFRAEQDTQQ
jgi:hypothetical protein